jgi:hypothetical protein
LNVWKLWPNGKGERSWVQVLIGGKNPINNQLPKPSHGRQKRRAKEGQKMWSSQKPNKGKN